MLTDWLTGVWKSSVGVVQVFWGDVCCIFFTVLTKHPVTAKCSVLCVVFTAPQSCSLPSALNVMLDLCQCHTITTCASVFHCCHQRQHSCFTLITMKKKHMCMYVCFSLVTGIQWCWKSHHVRRRSCCFRIYRCAALRVRPYNEFKSMKSPLKAWNSTMCVRVCWSWQNGISHWSKRFFLWLWGFLNDCGGAV